MDNHTRSSQDNTILVSYIMDIGELLLTAGAEVSRVEDTMERIGRAYGFLKSEIFTITSSMVFTVHIADDEIITQTRRIHSGRVNMERLERINALSRELCVRTVSVQELKEKISLVKHNREYSKSVRLCSYALISATFTMFFGGSIMDAFTSMITGIILYYVMVLGNKMKIQIIVLNIVCSFITGMSAVTLIKMGIGDSFDNIIIGNIMLLIPGMALTASLRDMIKGDIITGLLGLCEALFKAFAIAVGFTMVMILKGVY